MTDTIKFTLVSTVFNEAKRLDRTIDDLQKQTLQPSEIIITDAGSTDGTYDILLKWKAESKIPIVVLQKQRCNVAEGRNMAIRAARYDLIASTDFGCRFHPGWLESLMKPFSDPNVKAVGGAFTVIDQDLETMPAKAAYVLFNGYKDDIHQPWFTPTSRSVAYYKEVFEKVGGYYEWLTLAADDTIFGRLAKKKGIVFHMVDEPYVYWGRHSTATAYGKEAFRYGLGDGESHINFKNTISNLIQLVFRYVFFVELVILLFFIIAYHISPLFLLLLLPLCLGFKTYIDYTKMWLRVRSEKYNFEVFRYGFYLLELTRFYYLKGFYQGYFKSPQFRKDEAKKLEKLFAE